jgi:hypothetical protein
VAALKIGLPAAKCVHSEGSVPGWKPTASLPIGLRKRPTFQQTTHGCVIDLSMIGDRLRLTPAQAGNGPSGCASRG